MLNAPFEPTRRPPSPLGPNMQALIFSSSRFGFFASAFASSHSIRAWRYMHAGSGDCFSRPILPSGSTWTIWSWISCSWGR